MGDAVHRDFERDRDLLLNLFGGPARPLRDHLNVVIRHIRIGFNRQVVKGNGAPDQQQRAPTATRNRLFRALSISARIMN